MFNDPIHTADAIANPKFHSGDPVVLTHGAHKYVHGIFQNLREDVEWGAIREPSGIVTSHPVEWMESYRAPEGESTSSTFKNS